MKPKSKRVGKRSKNALATKGNIQAPAMGMAAKIDNLAIGLAGSEVHAAAATADATGPAAKASPSRSLKAALVS